MANPGPLFERIRAALLWAAAFAFACGVYMAATIIFRPLPPTAPVAIGVVTIERYSKAQDYAAAALFFLLVPPLTIWLRRLFQHHAEGRTPAATLLFLAPWFLSPFFHLTTGKIGWVVLLPIVLAFGAPRVYEELSTRSWFRRLFHPDLGPFHALLFAEGISWVLFRYFITGRRIAHVPTLFLEIVFMALFLALFWCAAILVARLTQLLFGHDLETTFKRITVAALPLVALPVIAVVVVPTTWPRALTIAAIVLSALLAWRIRTPMQSRTAWKLAALVVFPVLIYAFSYASTAHLSQWIDLFHRGEAVGPASDYLRGKVAYRDVFVLHGLLEDGLLDAWLMKTFGRSIEVAILRPVILGAFLGPLIWYLGIAVFQSIPLAVVCVAMSAWTTAENNRTFLQVAAVALFWNALQRRSRMSAIAAGVIAGIALFHSYEIGLYTITGAITAAIVIAILARRVEWDGLAPLQAVLFFLTGTAIGAAPFVFYLVANGAFDDFLVTSFVTIPRIIDAVWSLPFPDLVSTFRNDLNLHTLAEFVLFEKFHLILSPVVIAISAIYAIQRWMRRRIDRLDFALIVLTVFATIAQRTAFGRAEFRHQYFAAFLIGPMMVILGTLAARKIRETWRTGGEGTHAFLATLVVSMLPILAVLFWIPDLVNARINDVVGYYGRALRITRDEAAEHVSWRIKDVTRHIQELTRRSEPIFDFSNQPAFYFFADRPNPTRFYQVPILSPREFQAETIAALERAKPKVVLRKSPEGFDQFDGVTNDLRAQAVSAYIDENYVFNRSIRGVELWTRRAGAKAQPVAHYLKRIRVPGRKELVFGAVHRLVFPAVGSVPGVGGSYWQSDLTMHNPFRDPIPVTLRFVSGDMRLDRRLMLASRQTLRHVDVVRSFFGLPGGVGTLWLEHRENRAPVAVVKTSDVAHGGRASVEQPLSKRDSATANSDAAELTIVGIPGVEGQRVNVGIVNVGIIPATFRITARTRSGEQIGRPVESGIPEDEVWIVANVEEALGVRLDDTITLRLTAIAGTGVGFATIVSANGDNEFVAAVPAQQQ